jgi:hypothetical protein
MSTTHWVGFTFNVTDDQACLLNHRVSPVPTSHSPQDQASPGGYGQNAIFKLHGLGLRWPPAGSYGPRLIKLQNILFQ